MIHIEIITNVNDYCTFHIVNNTLQSESRQFLHGLVELAGLIATPIGRECKGYPLLDQ